ncbi:cytoplasmic protein [Nakamurella sp. YIM 132087]|uniref:Cytoplasmic protein n=1 Tax=Nakamurella alba TaxID=2665158 RepID=A0A7K1FSD0_9ACTN|nr:glutamine amidotransferase [Nakamurella alba]MTD17046.1 cytoplasmic protein [Nakamurella alba]
MSKILVIGESWFTYTVHQKGFDAFYTSDYTEGAGVFLQVLRDAGHEVTYIPSHEIATRFPATDDGLASYEAVVISDVGANSFQLAPETFVHSIPTADKSARVADYVAGGGGLLMVGGYLTFSGIDAKARWGRSPLAPALPVTLFDRDDRVELPGGAAPQVVAEHPVVAGLDLEWPALLGLNEVVAKDGATTLATCAGHPLLVLGEYGSGRSAAFTSDLAPHWAPPAFLDWAGYAPLWLQLLDWLGGPVESGRSENE